MESVEHGRGTTLWISPRRRRGASFVQIRGRSRTDESMDHLLEGAAQEEKTRQSRKGVYLPFANYYRQLTFRISDLMPEVRVYSEGDCTVSVDFVVAAVVLVLLLALLGPVLIPIAILFCAVWDNDRKWFDWLLQPLMVALACLPLYLLWAMTDTAFEKDTLQEFRRAENSMLELCGPYLCLLIFSFVCLADVCQCCIEKGTGQMLLDEMHEIKEQEGFVREIPESEPEPLGGGDNLGEQLCEIVQYIHSTVGRHEESWGCECLQEAPSSLTSKFMGVILKILQRMFEDGYQDEKDESQELRTMLEENFITPDQAIAAFRVSPLQLVWLVFCSLGPTLLPTVYRFVNGYEDFLFSSHPAVRRCQYAYLLITFSTSAHLLSSCYDLNERLENMQLATLATLYLVAPTKRRAVLAATYKRRFKKLVLMPTPQNSVTTPLAEAEVQRVTTEAGRTLSEGFGQLRYVMDQREQNAWKLFQIEYETACGVEKSSPSPTLHGTTSSHADSAFTDDDDNDNHDANKGTFSYLATRKFALLQLLARSDCLVLEVKSQVVALVLTMIVVMCALIVGFSIGLMHGHHAITPLFCVIFLPLIVIGMLLILNKLVMLEVYLYEDTLKILQSWRERMERLRYAVTLHKASTANRAEQESFFHSLIDPVAGLIDYTKNWQKRVKIFGLNASSSRRNRILLSIIAYFGLVFWHFLSHKTWYIELQQEFSTIAMSHGVVVLPE
ncbi:Uncharacterized protein SCF082_LOCUS51593 [Durusdinium trenchii]|uniref:Transmembrane protein n=1 Tax=Durusdinium trenchii TaxID=1381693 RepID=A0ABP0SFI3_9DINO